MVRSASAVLAACVAFSPSVEGIVRSEPVQAWIHAGGAAPSRLGNATAVAAFPLDALSQSGGGLTLEELRETDFPDLPENAADADAIRFAARQGLLQGYSDGTFRPDGFLPRSQAVTILRRTARLLGLDSGEAYAVRQDDGSVAARPGDSAELHTVSVNGVDLLLDDGAEARFLTAEQSIVTDTAAEGVLSVSDSPDTRFYRVTTDTLSVSADGAGTAVPTGSVVALPAVEEKTDAQWAVDAGILSSDDGLFRQVDRATVAEYLYRFARWAGVDVSCSGDLSRWPDGASVPEASREALSWGVESGVFRTVAEGSLSPSLPVTRGQMARLMTALIARIPEKTFANGGTGIEENGDLSVGGLPDETLSESGEAGGTPDGTLVESGARSEDRPLADDTIAEQEALASGGASPYAGENGWQAAGGSAEADMAAEISSRTDRGYPDSVSQARHEELQGAIDAVAKYYHADGLQVAVIEDGHLTDVYASGYAVRGKVPMTPDHKLRIASISKVLVGLAAMCLREEGTVDLDVPIGTYWNTTIRNPYHPNTPVNIRSLLTHTSSIYASEVSLTSDAVRNRLGSGQGFGRGTPGDLSCWNYNNYAFGVLGMTLEKASGRTVDQILDEAVFDALDIDGKFYAGDLERRDLVAPIYSGGSVGRTVDKQLSYHAGAPGSNGSCFAGGLTIGVRDLGKIAALLANDGVYEGVRLVSEESVELMEYREKVWLEGGFCQAMPLRYRMDAYGRERLYYHTGSAYGVFNGFSYDPDTKDGVVVLTSGASGARDKNGNYAVCGAIYDVVYKAIAR